MRLDLERTAAAAERLDLAEERDGGDGGCRASDECAKTLLAAETQEQQTQNVPEQAVAESADQQHPQAHPSRRAPAVHATHEAHVFLLDISPDSFGYGHANTSAGNCRDASGR